MAGPIGPDRAARRLGLSRRSYGLVTVWTRGVSILPCMTSIRVLIADDDPRMRHLVREVVSRGGAVVVAEATDGLAAVELALEHRPDVAVLDIRMPELAGDTAAQVLRTMMPHVGLVLLSSDPASADPHSVDAVDAVMSKLDMSSLAETIRDVAALRRGYGSIRIA